MILRGFRKQTDGTYHLYFYMVDSTDHISGKTGLSPTVTISKNGAAFGSPAGAVSEIANGWYKIAGNATDSNTLGDLLIHATATGADPSDCSYTIVSFDPFDSVRLGLTALPNAAAEAAGGLYTRGTGAGQINQPANGQIDSNVVKVAGTAQTAKDLGASVTQTGDSYARIGAPAGASVSADVAAVKGDTAGIKAKTDNLPLDPASNTQVSTRSTFNPATTTVDVGKISGNATAAAQLARSAATIVNGAAVAGALSNTQMTTDLTVAVNDHYKGRIIIWTSGALQNQVTDIIAYDGATKKLTFTAVTSAPVAADTFIIL